MSDKTFRCTRCNKDRLYNLKGLKQHQSEFCKGPLITDQVKEVKTIYINVIQNLNETNTKIKDENKNITNENMNYKFEIQNLKSELEKIKNELIENEKTNNRIIINLNESIENKNININKLEEKIKKIKEEKEELILQIKKIKEIENLRRENKLFMEKIEYEYKYLKEEREKIKQKMNYINRKIIKENEIPPLNEIEEEYKILKKENIKLISQIKYRDKKIEEIKEIKVKEKISNGEKTVNEILVELFSGYKFTKVRPSWLKNDITGKNLELDFYCEELKLAIEFQGQQHYDHTPYFHGEGETGDKNYASRLQRDFDKKKICKGHDITLIEIKYDENKEEIYRKLKKLTKIEEFRINIKNENEIYF